MACLSCVLLTACGGDKQPAPADTASPTVAVAPESTTVSPNGATEPDVSGGLPRVLFIGTSLTAGMGLDPDSAYPEIIARLADSAGYRISVSAAGVSGETSAGALRRVDWLSREKAAVVVIETGANDGLRGLDPDTTHANLTAIIKAVRAANPGTKVLLAQMEAPPNLGVNYTRKFHDVFLNVAREQGITLIPFFLEGVAGVSTLNQSDGIHPNAEGARRAAQNMWTVLAPVLRQIPGAYAK